MVAWRHAYAAARKGPWEQYARDRARFNREVNRLSATLDPILAKDHREAVYTDRFSESV